MAQAKKPAAKKAAPKARKPPAKKAPKPSEPVATADPKIPARAHWYRSMR